MLVFHRTSACLPGRVGDWLRGAGIAFHVRTAQLGDPLPPNLADHDGLLVLGGSMARPPKPADASASVAAADTELTRTGQAITARFRRSPRTGTGLG